MMRKTVGLLVAISFAAMLATGAMAATWYKVGTSGFTTTPSSNMDYKRIKFNSIATDSSGNVYATACNGNNDGVAGGLSIYKTDGTKIDVDVNALGLRGGITKLVRAGDGSVYGLQNWQEIHWNYDTGIDSRIIKIDPDGTVTVVYNAGNNGAWNSPIYKIQGMAVGDDGNIYFTRSGWDSYYKYHFLWRYDVGAQIVEEAPINTSNNGWSETHRMFDFEYVGDGWFNVIKSGGAEWRQDPINWTTNRTVGDVSNPGWGRDWVTALAYDPVRDALWTGARGTSKRCILTRWNGIQNGVAANDSVWHSLGDVDYGTDYWVSALAVDPVGDAWMGFTPGTTDPLQELGGNRGKVLRFNEWLGVIDEGTPEVGADICALAFNRGVAYALVLNRTTGEYSLYATPEPGSLIALGTGLIGLLGIVRRRR